MKLSISVVACFSVILPAVMGSPPRLERHDTAENVLITCPRCLEAVEVELKCKFAEMNKHSLSNQAHCLFLKGHEFAAKWIDCTLCLENTQLGSLKPFKAFNPTIDMFCHEGVQINTISSFGVNSNDTGPQLDLYDVFSKFVDNEISTAATCKCHESRFVSMNRCRGMSNIEDQKKCLCTENSINPRFDTHDDIFLEWKECLRCQGTEHNEVIDLTRTKFCAPSNLKDSFDVAYMRAEASVRAQKNRTPAAAKSAPSEAATDVAEIGNSQDLGNEEIASTITKLADETIISTTLESVLLQKATAGVAVDEDSWDWYESTEEEFGDNKVTENWVDESDRATIILIPTVLSPEIDEDAAIDNEVPIGRPRREMVTISLPSVDVATATRSPRQRVHSKRIRSREESPTNLSIITSAHVGNTVV